MPLPHASRTLAGSLALPILTGALAVLEACTLSGCGGTPAVQDRVTGASLLAVAPAADLVLPATGGRPELAVRMLYPARRGHYPLIVVAPAGAPSEGDYSQLATHWAGCGYVVLELRYPDAQPADARGAARVVAERAPDPALALAALTEIERRLPGLRGSIDSRQVTLVGHGLGVIVAMAAAGLGLEPGGGVAAELAAARFANVLLIGDPGAAALVPHDGWRSLGKPTFVVDAAAQPAGAAMPGRPEFKVIDPPSTAPHHELKIRDFDRCLGGVFCRVEGSGPPDYAALAALEDASTAFLDAYLKHDPAAIAWLARTDRVDLANGRARLSAR